MSLELTGTEQNHMLVRNAVVSLLREPDYSSAFASYVGHATTEYVNDTSMDDNGTWATDVEIVATATLLQTPVLVYTTYGKTKTWLKYDPLFSVSDGKTFSQCIYLINEREHFQRVLDCEMVL